MLFISSLIALVMCGGFIGFILRLANLVVWHERTHSALAVASVVMGLLLTLLMHSLWGLALSQLAAIITGSVTLMWILLIISTRRFIRFFYPDIVFKSLLNPASTAFGRRKIYNSGLLDDLLD